MPSQLSVLADPNRIAKTAVSSQNVYVTMSKAVVLALVVVTALWIAIVRHMSKKKETSTQNPTAVAPEKYSTSCPGTLEKNLRHEESFRGVDSINPAST